MNRAHGLGAVAGNTKSAVSARCEYPGEPFTRPLSYAEHFLAGSSAAFPAPPQNLNISGNKAT